MLPIRRNQVTSSLALCLSILVRAELNAFTRYHSRHRRQRGDAHNVGRQHGNAVRRDACKDTLAIQTHCIKICEAGIVSSCSHTPATALRAPLRRGRAAINSLRKCLGEIGADRNDLSNRPSIHHKRRHNAMRIHCKISS
jgi:hypothetical protein